MTNAYARRQPAAGDDGFLREDLTLGLHAVTEFNQTIRYADTKAGALAAVQALAVTVLAAKRDSGTSTLLSTLILTGCLVSVLVSAMLLARGQVPRLYGARPGGRPSRIAFPSLASMTTAEVLQAPPLALQHEQVWRQASELATIAMAKYRWLHRATASTLVTLTVVLLWLGVTTWLMPH